MRVVLVNNTVMYFNLFVNPFKQHDVCKDQRAKLYSLILIFSTLWLWFMTRYFNENYREGAFPSPLFTLLVTQACKRYYRSRLRNVLGQLGIYCPFSFYENLKSSRCRWMKATDMPAGLRQSVTSLVYKLYTDMLFQLD